MFTGASNLAEGVDKTLIFIFTIAFIFIVGITVFMIYTVIHFSRKKGKPAMQFTGSTKLEILWTVVPFILVMVMFYYGWVGFARMRNVPDNAIPVTAIGRMWEWEFDYGNGMKSKELVVPVNKAIRVNLKSLDVNHALFIPAFRVKEDVIRGYNDYLWFIPTIVGEYEILCTEYCGVGHSSMLSKARVLDQDQYDKWFREFKSSASRNEPDGYLFLRNSGCLGCHSIDGTILVGPSFKGLYGNKIRVIVGENEKSVVADEKYIANSIFDPDSEVVSGFRKGLMKSYKDLVKDSDIQIIIAYLKTLSNENAKPQ